MGILRDNWDKGPKIQGKRKPYCKKQKYELRHAAANTETGLCHIHTVHMQRGNKKYHALRLDVGNFPWGLDETRITDVVYNASNYELVHTNVLVKNCMVLIDSTPYLQQYESHYALPLDCKKEAKVTPEEEETV